jgi:hypothetical protein
MRTTHDLAQFPGHHFPILSHPQTMLDRETRVVRGREKNTPFIDRDIRCRRGTILVGRKQDLVDRKKISKFQLGPRRKVVECVTELHLEQVMLEVLDVSRVFVLSYIPEIPSRLEIIKRIEHCASRRNLHTIFSGGKAGRNRKTGHRAGACEHH